MAKYQLKLSKELFLDLFRAIGRVLVRKPIFVGIGFAAIGSIFLLFIWWQNVFNLDFSAGEEKEFIGLHEQDLKQVFEIIERREQRFKAAPGMEYRNIFR